MKLRIQPLLQAAACNDLQMAPWHECDMQCCLSSRHVANNAALSQQQEYEQAKVKEPS